MTTGISANGLVQMTGIDSAKIRARLAGLAPCRTQGKWLLPDPARTTPPPTTIC
jgi:hypothetical protein